MLVGFAAIISVGVFSATNTAEASQEDVPGMMGHITLTLQDSEGNITDYVQTDNVVTIAGVNCISENSFGVNSACDATFFTFIGLGFGSTPTSTNVENPLAGGGGCIRSDADDASTGDVATSAGTSTETVTLTVIFGGGGSSGAGITSVDCEATVSEAGLFNSVTGAAGQMFAHQAFTGIAVGNLDTLTVTWTVTII